MDNTTKSGRRGRRWAGAAGLLAAGAITGGVLASNITASAATPTAASSYSSSSTATSGTSGQQGQATFPAHGTAAHEDQEKPVTGANATQAGAAAVKAVGSGTAGAVTTDVSGSGYEVTVTKSDGSQVEVHLDQSFNVAGHGATAG